MLSLSRNTGAFSSDIKYLMNAGLEIHSADNKENICSFNSDRKKINMPYTKTFYFNDIL